MAERIFIHGLESSNQGTKSLFFREKFPDMIIPNFTGSLEERMERLEQVLSGSMDIRLVGSSFGGLMASLFAMNHQALVTCMVLLAPAINLIEMPGSKTISIPVQVYHGRNDLVIPIEEVEPVARKIFTDLSFHSKEDDHFLHNTFKTIDWELVLA